MSFKFASSVAAIFASSVPVSAATTLFFDDFSYPNPSTLNSAGWAVVETGDLQMQYQLTGATIDINNQSGVGGNDQSIIFARDINTTGEHDISVTLQWRANDLDDFELSDFIRIVVYNGGFPSETNRTIPWTTEGLWIPGVNPATTTTTTIVDLDAFASDNANLQIGFEVNTSLDREVIIVDDITIAGTAIPEPSTLALLSAVLCGFTFKRRRPCAT